MNLLIKIAITGIVNKILIGENGSSFVKVEVLEQLRQLNSNILIPSK